MIPDVGSLGPDSLRQSPPPLTGDDSGICQRVVTAIAALLLLIWGVISIPAGFIAQSVVLIIAGLLFGASAVFLPTGLRLNVLAVASFLFTVALAILVVIGLSHARD